MRGEHALQFRARASGARVCGSAPRHRAHLGAMAADRRQAAAAQRSGRYRRAAAADQRQRAAGELLQARRASAAAPAAPTPPAASARYRGWCRRYRAGSRTLPQVGRERGVCDFHRQIRDVFLSLHVYIPSYSTKDNGRLTVSSGFVRRRPRTHFDLSRQQHKRSADRVAERNIAARSGIDQAPNSKRAGDAADAGTDRIEECDGEEREFPAGKFRSPSDRQSLPPRRRKRTRSSRRRSASAPRAGSG